MTAEYVQNILNGKSKMSLKDLQKKEIVKNTIS